MTKRKQTKSPLLGATSLCSLLAACTATGGERFADGCPEDEICTDATPNGLIFQGPSLSDDLLEARIRPVAAGGTANISVLLPSFSIFTLPYLALSTTDAFSVDGRDENVVSVTATQSGDALLRIVDAEGLLYDRVALTAAPIAEARLLIPPILALPNATEFALARGRQAHLVIALLAADGERLVDDTLTITPNVASTQLDHGAWDSVTVSSEASSAAFTVHAGDATLSFEYPTVETLEHIVLAYEPTLTEGIPGRVCFDGTFGSYSVLGIEWSVSIDGDLPLMLLGNCVDINPYAGTTTLDVTGLGASASFELPVAPAGAGKPQAQRAARPRDAAGFATPGERAQLR